MRTGWQPLVMRLHRKGVIERDVEASRMWTFTFNEHAMTHFQYIFEADFAILFDLWERL